VSFVCRAMMVGYFRVFPQGGVGGCSREHLDRRPISPPVPPSLRVGLVSANHKNM
jgi:hypothetical protein